MLSRNQRLTTASFARTFEQGRVYRHPLLQMRAVQRVESSQNALQSTLTKPHLAEPITRVAFVAPKKLGPATLRNRTRRRLSEAYRAHLRLQGHSEAKSAPPGFDLIFLATASALQASVGELTAAFDQLSSRLRRDAARGEATMARR